ncbi:hypothetical protein ACU4GD_32545 [Cupriavidus basilensis]
MLGVKYGFLAAAPEDPPLCPQPAPARRPHRSAFGIGRAGFPSWRSRGFRRAGHVRVGLEDNICLERACSRRTTQRWSPRHADIITSRWAESWHRASDGPPLGLRGRMSAKEHPAAGATAIWSQTRFSNQQYNTTTPTTPQHHEHYPRFPRKAANIDDLQLEFVGIPQACCRCRPVRHRGGQRRRQPERSSRPRSA